MCSYLKVLLPVKSDVFGLDLSVFDVNFVATQDNWDVLTHSHQIPVPIGHILIRHS